MRILKRLTRSSHPSQESAPGPTYTEPTIRLPVNPKFEVVEGECALCGKPFHEGDWIKICPQCKLFYHSRCVDALDGKCARYSCSGRPS